MDELRLSQKEREFIKFLRKLGVLKTVDAKHVKMTAVDGGEVIIACGDGKRFSDLYGHRIRLTNKIRPEYHVPHMLTLNGGALLLSAESPLYNPVMAYNTMYAVLFNQINNIVIYGHAPCGAGNFEDIDIKKNFELLIHGEATLRKLFAKIANNPESHFKRFLDKNTKNLKEREDKIGWIKSLFQSVQTKRYFHVDDDENKKSFFISLEAWEQNYLLINKKWDELNATYALSVVA